MSEAETASAGVQISLIISTSNRAQHLRTVLYALNRQTYRNFEIVVVIGPTQDETFLVLEEFAGRIHVVKCPVFNLSVSRNLGVEAAVGEVVAFLDDDALPGTTWLEQLAWIFASGDVAGTGGKVYRIWPDGRGDIQFLLGMSSILAEDRDVRLDPDTPVNSDTPTKWWFPRLTGGNMAYDRAALVEVGGFDERFAYMFEEAELAVRMGLKNHRLLPLQEAVVYHFPAGGPNRQQQSLNINWYAWIRGSIYFALKHGPPNVGWQSALTKIISHINHIFRILADYNHTDQLSKSAYFTIISRLIQGIGWGFWFGLFKSRNIIQNKFQQPARPFMPFLVDQANRTPTLPPPGIPPPHLSLLDKEPLRLAYLALTDDNNLALSLPQKLAALGHEVHLIRLGGEDRVTVYQGIFIHEIVPATNRYLPYRQSGYPSLFTYLNHSHLAYEKLQSLIINHKIQIIVSPLTHLEGLVTVVKNLVPIIVTLSHPTKDIGKSIQENQLISALQAKMLTLCSGLTLSKSIKRDTLEQKYGVSLRNKPTGSINTEVKDRRQVPQEMASFYRTIIDQPLSDSER